MCVGSIPSIRNAKQIASISLEGVYGTLVTTTSVLAPLLPTEQPLQ